MSLHRPAVTSDRQLVRLLQIGVVLEELVETDATRGVSSAEDPAVGEMLREAATEAARHREQLETLIGEVDASADEAALAELVEAQYTPDEESDGVLYDQLAAEETAFKFYDDLLAAIEAADVAFSVDRERLVATLERIRADEKDGVETVTELMDR